ncbi:hypothetical protein P8452_17138 [Trifolium repens]|nr:hypothetical protein P8452_17138 [Trifolium repens]
MQINRENAIKNKLATPPKTTFHVIRFGNQVLHKPFSKFIKIYDFEYLQVCTDDGRANKLCHLFKLPG